MDESIKSLEVPMPTGVQPAPQPTVAPDKLDLSNKDIAAAAAHFNMSSISVDSLLASHTLGKAFKDVGVIKLGRVLIFEAAQHARGGISKCDEIIDATDDGETLIGALTVKQKFVNAQLEAGERFIRSAELDGNDDSDKGTRIKPLQAGQPAGPFVFANQAVVNNTNTKEK